ncbi:MAG: cold shock domain-containing protein [Bacteroidota bacterium]|jgi:cold shock CspA family protein
MAKSQETLSKKEKEKAKLKKRKEKAEKREERKASAVKGQSLEDMMAYVDENGNITSTPPDLKKRREVNAEDMVIGVAKKAAPEPEELVRKGVISFFNESKGYGFIKDLKNQASVFVHINGLLEQVKENDKVTFEIEMTHKGASATKVQIDRGDKVPAAPVVVAEAKSEEPKTDETV